MTPMNCWYRVIVFGHNEHGFWNEPHVFSTFTKAFECFQEAQSQDDATGAFLIIQQHESWFIADSFEADGYYVSYDFTFKVRQNSNQLCAA